MAREPEDRDDVVDLKDDEKKPKGTPMLDDSDLESEEDVDGPDNAAARAEQRRDQERRDRRRARAEAEDDVDDERLSHGGDDDELDDDDKPSQSRRRRRNRARREAQRRDAQAIAQLSQEVNALKGHLAKVGTDQIHLAVGDIDGNIRYTQNQLDEIDAAISRAVTESDGALHARALKLRDEANRRLDGLVYEKRRLAAMTQPQQERQPPQQQQAQKDPAAVRHAEDFMDDFPDFDFNGTDQFSLAVKAIDAAVDLEGRYKPNQRAYWAEVRRRMKKQNLIEPEGDDVDDDDDVDVQPARRERRDALPPRSGRSSGGARPAGSSYRLSQQELETLDEMGLRETNGLNKDQLDYRRKLVSKWKAGFEAEAKSPRAARR